MLELPKVEKEGFGGPQPVHWHLRTRHAEVHHVAAKIPSPKTIPTSADKKKTGLFARVNKYKVCSISTQARLSKHRAMTGTQGEHLDHT